MEYRRKCTVCGNVYCYTDSDIKNSNLNSINSTVSAIGAVASIMGGGNLLNAQVFNAQSERYGDKVVDFTECPHCHSRNTVELSEEEWEKAQKQIELSSNKQIQINQNATTDTLKRRVQLFLEDSDWTSANTYCEAILDVDPENADAYLGKLLAELQIQKKELLPNCAKPFDDSGNYQKCIRFADTSLANEIKGYLQQVKEQSEHSRMDDIYQQGVSAMSSAKDISGYKAAIQQFKQIPDYNDANKKINYCYEQIKAYQQTEEANAEAREISSQHRKKIFIPIITGVIVVVLIICSGYFISQNKKISKVSEKLVGQTITFSCVEDSKYFSHHRSGEITFGANKQCREVISVYYTGKDLEGLPTKGKPATGEKEGEYTISFSGGNTIITDLEGYKYILVYDDSGIPTALIDDTTD